MAQIWEYIANYNPQGFYEDNRSKMLSNDIKSVQLNAANRENERQKKIWAIEDALANGDNSMLRAYGVYSPEKRGKLIENEEKMLEYARPLAEAYMQASPENKAKVYGQIYNRLKGVMDVSDMPVQWNENVDGIMETIANSDPQKQRDLRVAELQEQRDARLNEYTKERDTTQFGRDLQKLELAHQYSEQLAENNLNRDIRKLQFAYDRADQKTKEAADFISQAFTDGKISETDYITALGKTLGAEISPKSAAEKLGEDFITGNMTPEKEKDYISRLNALNMAKNTKSVRTPAQEAKDLYGAGYTPESILKYQQSGNINDLEPRPIQGGSIAADVQKYNMYNQEKTRIENEQGAPLSDEQDLDLQGKLGIDGQGLKNAEFAIKHGYKMEEIGAQNQGRLDVVGAQGQNAINLENTKQGNRVALADINAQNAQELENLKQQNRVGLAFINDKISQGKELRELDNKKSLEEFKNQLPTQEKLKYIAMANEMTRQGMPTTAEELLLNDYQNALKTAEIDRQYKQAETEKALAELPFVGKTPNQQNYEYMVGEGIPQDVALEKAFGNKGTTVNVGNGEPAFKKKLAEKDADAVAEAEKDIVNLDKQIALLEQTGVAVKDPSLYQGTLGDLVNSYRTFLSSMGVDIKGLDSGAILNTGSSMLMGNLRKDLMPGPLSDRDLQFLIRMTPSLTKTPQQNAAILNMYKKMYQRQRDILRFRADYGRKNGTLNGVIEAEIKAGLDKPVFTDKEKALAMGRNIQRNENSYSSKLKVGQTFGGYKFKGGDPYDKNNWEKK